MSSRARESGCYPAKPRQTALLSALAEAPRESPSLLHQLNRDELVLCVGPHSPYKQQYLLSSDPASAERAARPEESEYPSGLRTNSTPFRPWRGTLTTHPLSARKIPAPSKASKRRSAAALTPNDEPRTPEGERVRADTKRQGKAGTSSPPAPPGSAGVGEHRKVPHGPNGAHPSR